MSTGGPKYAVFLEQELKAERDRRINLDTRAQSVVTVSGSLVTLLAAVGAFISSRKDYRLPSVTHAPLIITVVMFTVTIALAILASFNFRYDVADKQTLMQLPRQHWADSEDIALKNITATNVTTVTSLRYGNDQKATFILVALIAQLLSLGSLGLTVYLMVINAN